VKKIITFLPAKRLLFLVAIIVLAGITGCYGGESTLPTLPVAPHPPAISFVNLSINDASDSSSGITVKTYLGLSESAYTDIVDIIYYNDVNPPITPGVPAYSANGTYVVKAPDEESATWEDVPPGTHIFYAQLVYSDNDTPFDPPVMEQSIISIPTADLKMPQIRMISLDMNLPLPPYNYNEDVLPLSFLSVQFNCTVYNFKLSDDKIGKENAPGEGHFIYYLNANPPTIQGQPATTAEGTYKVTTESFYTWEDVPTGEHTFALQLVNNDNTPLDPPVVAKITVIVPSIYW